MQDLSYVSVNQRLSLGDYQFELAIYTFKNTYTLSPEHTTIQVRDGKLEADCTALLWAGGQELTAGSAHITAQLLNAGIQIQAQAQMGQAKETIRSVKLSVFGLQRGQIINLIDARPKNIPDEGLLLHYPEGWREVGTPLLVMNGGEKLCYLRSLDDRIREKTFAFVCEDADHVTAELIFEEEATCFSSRTSVPTWEIGYADTLDEIYAPHIRHVEQAYGLQKWTDRPDVPEWAKEISLVAAIHGQHWTGHIFNDYDGMLRAIQKLCTMIEGKRILAYLPGWEGRYYWQYGDYRPDGRMGGEEGFHRLCDGARELGVHLMPMFGMNVVGKNMENYSAWGAPSIAYSSSGNHGGGSVDWDGSRHYDHGSMAGAHPGAPQWRNRLVAQIHELADQYGFDAVFLDIAARWVNDPNFYYYDSVVELSRRIKEGYPDMLMSGEAWYDGLMTAFPLIQCGHTDGKMHYHDEAYEPMVAPYVRSFGHLCLGDPATLSTGVHEQGRNPEWYVPYREGVIPTITIAEDPFTKNPERVEQIIRAAKKYAQEFCP